MTAPRPLRGVSDGLLANLGEDFRKTRLQILAGGFWLIVLLAVVTSLGPSWGIRVRWPISGRVVGLGALPMHSDPPAHEVSATDWLTLVEKVGLAPYLEDTTK
jgi:hypothetical protein